MSVKEDRRGELLRILIADDDEPTREVLARGMSRRTRRIATAADGEEALATAITFAPHLVITDVTMPRMSGWDLVVQMRRRPETALTPVIFATGADDHKSRMRGLRLGAVDYVTKPLDLEELSLRVRNALRHRLHAERAVHAALVQGVAGSLAHLPLSSLLNLLALERRSGVLEVLVDGGAGRLVLCEGNVVSARLGGTRGASGADCVYRLLSATEGQFVYTDGAVTVADEIGVPTMELLMEGARRLDEKYVGELL